VYDFAFLLLMADEQNIFPIRIVLQHLTLLASLTPRI